MKVIYLSAYILILCVSCREGDSGRSQMLKAQKAEVEGYQDSDYKRAMESLLVFRKHVVETKGFNGLLDVDKTILVSDARLFSLCYNTGYTNDAMHWYSSYLMNLNTVRDREGKPKIVFEPKDVLKIVDELDKPLTVRWKINSGEPQKR